MLDRIDRYLRVVERGLDFVAALALVLMMVSIFGDVVSRHLFGHSIGGVHEVTEMYLMAFVVFLSVARAQDLGKHIAVDALIGRLEGRARAVLQTVSCLVGFAVMAPISWKALQMMVEHYREGRMTTGVVEFPTWIGWLAVALGCIALSARLLLQSIRSAQGRGGPPEDAPYPGHGERS